MQQYEIFVPKNINAKDALDKGKTKVSDIEKLVLSKQEFDYIYDNGIIDAINNIADILISDYEEELIQDIFKIEKIQKYLKNYSKKNNCNFDLISKLLNMFENAMIYKLGIYFYF